MEKFDLHMHTNLSDGTLTPTELVQCAARLGVPLIALTDHDTVAGVMEAQAEGARAGVRVLGGVEIDTAFETELHILGIRIDPDSQVLKEMLAQSSRARDARNQRILEKLAKAGKDVRAHMRYSEGNTTRLHIANALYDAGYAESVSAAFMKYLHKGCIGYAEYQRPTQRQVIRTIHQAGGLAVLAHPHKIKTGDVAALIKRLAEDGLDALELFYPGMDTGDFGRFSALAQQNGLLLSCGSDFHGENRKNTEIGCSWRDTQALREIYALLC